MSSIYDCSSEADCAGYDSRGEAPMPPTFWEWVREWTVSCWAREVWLWFRVHCGLRPRPYKVGSLLRKSSPDRKRWTELGLLHSWYLQSYRTPEEKELDDFLYGDQRYDLLFKNDKNGS